MITAERGGEMRILIELLQTKAHIGHLLVSSASVLLVAIGIPEQQTKRNGVDAQVSISQTPNPPGAPFVKITRTIERPITEVFDHVMNVDLTRIFPSLASTSMPTGFHTVGQQRTNILRNGTQLTETLTIVERPHRFGYRMFDFSSPTLSDNLSHIEGGWVFVDNGNGTTSIEWIYAFVPKSPSSRSLVESQIAPRYQSLLESALDKIKSDLEN
ncbi:MAG: SRPBCC family protein [Sphingorhabdus sp.]|uniref:SRPBCC family protein n=1 Tax=Sphingorhabdus sp. TaxID=1902408 RepID=UPI003C84E59E